MLATAKSPNKEDMWGVYLKPFSLKRRASKHFSPRWKASSRSSCHISSFLAKLTSTISRWGVYVKDFFLSPISLFHRYTPAPHPTPPPYVCHPLSICLSLILLFSFLHFTILFLSPSRCFKAHIILSVSPLPYFFFSCFIPMSVFPESVNICTFLYADVFTFKG